MRRPRVVVAVLVAVVAALGGAGIASAADPVPRVSGTATDQSGNRIAGVAVTATGPGGTTVVSGAATTDATGAYAMEVAAGSYDFHFVPPATSGLQEVVVSGVNVTSNRTLNIQFTPVPRTLSGVLRVNGSPVGGASVSVAVGASGVTVTTGSDGRYSFTLRPGVYRPSVSLRNIAGLPQFVNIDGGPTFDLTVSDVVQDLSIDVATSTLTIIARDPAGNPVPDVLVGGAAGVGAVALFPGAPPSQVVSGADTNPRTDATGTATVAIVRGSTINAGNLCVNFGNGNRACATEPVVLNADTTVTLVRPDMRTLSGVLRVNGTPVAGASVSVAVGASGVTVTTGSDGRYSFTLRPGVYRPSVSLRNIAGLPQFVNIDGGPTFDLTVSDVVQDLSIDVATSTLTVIAKDPAGNPIPDVVVGGAIGVGSVAVFPGAPPSQVVSGADTNPRTDATGTATVAIVRGSTINAGNLCVNFGNGNRACATEPVVLNADTTVILTRPDMRTLSGVVRVNGSPVGGALVSVAVGASGVTVTTGSDGRYSFTLRPGVYRPSVSLRNIPGLPQVVNINGGPTFDLTTTDVVQDLSIDVATTTLTVIAKDPAGNPIPDLVLSATAAAGTLVLFPGAPPSQVYSGVDGNPRTDAAGAVAITYLRGSAISAGWLCVNFDNGNRACNSDPLTLVNDTTIVFQQPRPVDTTPPVVTVPDDLAVVATGPAGAEVAFVATANDAVDGDLPVTCTPASGSVFPVGATTVMCTATDAAGNTGSVAFTVTVAPPPDLTPPQITLQTPPAAATYTQHQLVTLKFGCTDEPGGSGVATCTATVDGAPIADGAPLPTTVTGTHTVTVTTADRAGNAATDSRAYTVTAPVPACSVPLAGTVTGSVVIGAGQTCTAAPGTTINGSVTVTGGGTLTLPGGTINGNITVAAGTLTLDATRVNGNVAHQSGSLTIRAGTTVAGNTTVTGGTTIAVSSSEITGNLRIQNVTSAGAAITVCGSTVRGNLQVNTNRTASPITVGRLPGAACTGNRVTGTLQVQNNTVTASAGTAAVVVAGNAVNGNATISANTWTPVGTAPAALIAANIVGGSLACAANVGAPTNGGSANAVTGQRTGQCANL